MRFSGSFEGQREGADEWDLGKNSYLCIVIHEQALPEAQSACG